MMSHNMTQIILDKLIAVEGPDGIGKTKQAGLLVYWLNEEFNSRYCMYAFYQKELNSTNHIYTGFRELIYSLYGSVSTKTIARLAALNRYVLQEDIKEDLTSSGALCVVDRWNISTHIYLKCDPKYNDKSFEDIHNAYYYLDDINTYVPGLTIMLVGMNGIERQANRSANNNMFEDVDIEHKRRLAQSYIDFDTSLYAGKVVKINNDYLTVDETQGWIRQEVIKYLESI